MLTPNRDFEFNTVRKTIRHSFAVIPKQYVALFRDYIHLNVIKHLIEYEISQKSYYIVDIEYYFIQILNLKFQSDAPKPMLIYLFVFSVITSNFTRIYSIS